ncbi:MAG: PAC2 family protein [Nitrososphaerota archaeon]|jgi:proteasome assembly chaperone (PAC2) family protein|nr:PAC2 family protein [Nitrososphaerota archaeon]
MDTPYLHMLSNPQLENPIFVQGLPGFGNVGHIAAHLMVKFFDAKLFAELYAPTFPDYISITPKGIAYLQKYDFYYAQTGKNNIVILSSDTQPSLDDVVAHYTTCDEVLNFVESLGCKFLVTMGGVPITEDKAEIFVAATSNRLATEFMEKGGVIYSKGRIIGGTGLTLALAKERNIDGACLLGTTLGFKADSDAGFLIFKFLMNVLGEEIKEEMLKEDLMPEQ